MTDQERIKQLEAENAVMREALELYYKAEWKEVSHDGKVKCCVAIAGYTFARDVARFALFKAPRTESFAKYVAALEEVAFSARRIVQDGTYTWSTGLFGNMDLALQKLEQAKQGCGK